MKIYAKVDGAHYEFERPEVDSRGFHIGSVAKYCPLCLAGWSQMTGVLENLGTMSGPRMIGHHSVAGQLCARCGEQVPLRGSIPGSLLEEPQTNCQTLDWDLLYYLPRQLLLREFRLHDQFLNRQDNSNANTQQANFRPGITTPGINCIDPSHGGEG